MTSGFHFSTILFPVVTALLFEELTFGGLVRLLLAPWPVHRKQKEHTNRKRDTKCSR